MADSEDIEKLKDRWNIKPDNDRPDITLSDMVVERLKLIHGGTVSIDSLVNFLSKHEIVKLANRIDLRGISIPSTDFSNIELTSIDFSYAEFENMNFSQAVLMNCIFDSATFRGGSLENADLRNCTFRGAKVYDTKITYNDFAFAELDGALFVEPDSPEQPSNPRLIKQIYHQCGRYRDAGKQYYKEMKYTKKQAWKNRKYGHFLILWISHYLFGYGERPVYILGWAIFFIVSCSLIYFLLFPNQICYNDNTEDFDYARSLYFSITTFATLGYGDWHPLPQCTGAQIVASLEALIGILLVSIGAASLGHVLMRE